MNPLNNSIIPKGMEQNNINFVISVLDSEKSSFSFSIKIMSLFLEGTSKTVESESQPLLVSSY